MSKKKIQLICRYHPIDPVPQDRYEIVFRRQKLKTLITQYMSRFNHISCWVNGNKLTDDEVKGWRLKEGDNVVISPALDGGLAAAILTVGKAIAGAASAGGFVGFATRTAIMFGLGYIANTLLAPDTPSLGGLSTDTPTTNPNYSWSQVTLQKAGTPIPLCFGHLKLGGNIIDGHTVVDGEGNETRNLLVSYGLGPWNGPVADTLMINDQPVNNFTSISNESKYGTLDQTATTNFSQTLCEYWPSNNQAEYGTPVTFTTPYSEFDDLNIILYYRARKINSAGAYVSESVGVKVEISEHGAESWSTLVNTTLSNDTDDIKKITYSASGSYTGGSPVTITNGKRYDIKVTKTTEDAADSYTLNDLYLKMVQEVIDVAFSHPKQVVTEVSAVATEEISGSMSITQEWETQVMEVYDGETWTIEYSNNPAWIIHYLLTLPVISGDGSSGNAYDVERYDGIDPADISNYTEFLSQLVTLAARCDDSVSDGDGGTVKRYTFNGIFSEMTSIWEAIKEVATVCDCEVRPWGDGYRIYSDKLWTGSVTALYSAGNIIPGSYQESEVPDEDKASEFEMTIQNADRGFDEDLIPYYGELIGNASKTVTVNGRGTTNDTQASRKVKRLAAHNELVNWVNQFSVALDGLSNEVMDVIYVAPPWKKDGRVLSYSSGAVIELDKPPIQSADDTLILRTHNSATGYDSVEAIAVVSVDGREVTLASTPSVLPIAQETVYAYGPTSEVIKKWRIKSIIQSDDPEHGIIHTLRCEEYFDELYPSDSWDPTVFDAGFNVPTVIRKSTQTLTRHDISQIIPTRRTPAYMIPLPVNLAFSGNGSTTISWLPADSGSGIFYLVEGTAHAITEDSTADTYVYWDPAYPTIFRTTDDPDDVFTAGGFFVAVNDSGTPVPVYGIPLLNAGILQANSITADKLTAGEIISGAAQIKDGIITGAKLVNSTITGAKIDTATITNANIVDGTIQHAKIGTGQIYQENVASSAIIEAKIGNLEVSTAKIKLLNVTGALIANGAGHVEGSSTASSVSIGSSYGSVLQVGITSQGHLISGNASCSFLHSGTGLDQVFFYLDIAGSAFCLGSYYTNVDGQYYGIALSGLATPGSGTRYVTVYAKQAGPGSGWTLNSGAIHAIEHLGK